MVRQKQVVERRLTNRELDRELSKIKFRSKEKQSRFDKISKETWFRQYAKGSTSALKTITKKVKDGIRHGKYTYKSVSDIEPIRGTAKKRKPTKAQKKVEQQTKKISEKASRKQREKIKQEERSAPSGRKYSSVEIHEGINSKRAKAWRKKEGIPESDV